MFTEFFNTQMNYIRAVRETFGHAKHEEVTVKPAEEPTQPTEPEEKDPTQEEEQKQQVETQTVKKSKKATV